MSILSEKRIFFILLFLFVQAHSFKSKYTFMIVWALIVYQGIMFHYLGAHITYTLYYAGWKETYFLCYSSIDNTHFYVLALASSFYYFCLKLTLSKFNVNSNVLWWKQASLHLYTKEDIRNVNGHYCKLKFRKNNSLICG